MFARGSPAEPRSLTLRRSDSYCTDINQRVPPAKRPAGNAPLYGAAGLLAVRCGKVTWLSGRRKSGSCKLRGAWAGHYQVRLSFPSWFPFPCSSLCQFLLKASSVNFRSAVFTSKTLTNYLSIVPLKKKKKSLSRLVSCFEFLLFNFVLVSGVLPLSPRKLHTVMFPQTFPPFFFFFPMVI